MAATDVYIIYIYVHTYNIHLYAVHMFTRLCVLFMKGSPIEIHFNQVSFV